MLLEKFNYGRREIITIYRRKDFHAQRACACLSRCKNQLQRNFPSNFAKFPVISFKRRRTVSEVSTGKAWEIWPRLGSRVRQTSQWMTKTAIHFNEFAIGAHVDAETLEGISRAGGKRKRATGREVMNAAMRLNVVALQRKCCVLLELWRY